MKKIVLLAILATLFSAHSKATVYEVYGKIGLWNAFLFQKSFNEKMYFHNELRFRVIGEFDNVQQFLVRPSFHYLPIKWLEFSAGYTYSLNAAYNSFGAIQDLPEHNTWEQVATRNRLGKLSFHTRTRYENRFVGQLQSRQPDEIYFSFRNRLRTMLEVGYQLSENDKLSVYDEAFWISPESEQLPSVFAHQNWIGLNFSHNFSGRLSGYLGLMRQYLYRNELAHERNLLIRIGAKLKL